MVSRFKREAGSAQCQAVSAVAVLRSPPEATPQELVPRAGKPQQSAPRSAIPPGRDRKPSPEPVCPTSCRLETDSFWKGAKMRAKVPLPPISATDRGRSLRRESSPLNRRKGFERGLI